MSKTITCLHIPSLIWQGQDLQIITLTLPTLHSPYSSFLDADLGVFPIYAFVSPPQLDIAVENSQRN